MSAAQAASSAACSAACSSSRPAAEPPDDDFVPVDVVPGPPALNGSLLSKSENDCSWPVPADVGTASTSCDEPFGVRCRRCRGDPPPLSVGAAGSGVVAVGAGAGVDGVEMRPPAASPLRRRPVERHHRVHRVRARKREHAHEADRNLLLFFRLRLRSVGDVFACHVSPLLPTRARWRCQPTYLPSLWSSRPSTYRSCPWRGRRRSNACRGCGGAEHESREGNAWR